MTEARGPRGPKARSGRSRRQPKPTASAGPPGVALIEGRQPVREALRSGRRVRRILVAQGAEERGALAEIVRLATSAGIAIERVPRALLDGRAESRAHQGVVAEAEPYRPRDWREGLIRARKAGQIPLVLALDGIEDPQNLGALLRSAEALGVHAVLLPRHRSAGLTAAVGKAAAGALEHLVIDLVGSLERALAECREEGLWVVALAGDGTTDLDRCALVTEPLAVVVGGEGRGVSHLVKSRADAVVRIPLSGRVESLNASAAGAVCLWEVTRRRRGAGSS